ncbi:MAG: hypothetical protein A2284_00190 [Deltaproteobacteria bacterium RIFOXYA12_FULL_61_11]|nr:MAG: hypothetical protein A2284_00190 [Deltaproteobacteria bacterium RIFOXYA12_FULL_61_11]
MNLAEFPVPRIWWPILTTFLLCACGGETNLIRRDVQTPPAQEVPLPAEQASVPLAIIPLAIIVPEGSIRGTLHTEPILIPDDRPAEAFASQGLSLSLPPGSRLVGAGLRLGIPGEQILVDEDLHIIIPEERILIPENDILIPDDRILIPDDRILVPDDQPASYRFLRQLPPSSPGGPSAFLCLIQPPQTGPGFPLCATAPVSGHGTGTFTILLPAQAFGTVPLPGSSTILAGLVAWPAAGAEPLVQGQAVTSLPSELAPAPTAPASSGDSEFPAPVAPVAPSPPPIAGEPEPPVDPTSPSVDPDPSAEVPDPPSQPLPPAPFTATSLTVTGELTSTEGNTLDVVLGARHPAGVTAYLPTFDEAQAPTSADTRWIPLSGPTAELALPLTLTLPERLTHLRPMVWLAAADGAVAKAEAPTLVHRYRCDNQWCLLHGGTFPLGSNGATATLQPFQIMVAEVTATQYAACVNARVCTAPSDTDTLYGSGNARWHTYGVSSRGNLPVNMVTWAQARAFCAWQAPGGDLPSEAQWSYAAGGADGRTYPWGDAVPNGAEQYSNCQNCTGYFDDLLAADARPAGRSPFGLLHMAGNLDEWVLDSYTPSACTELPAGSPCADFSASEGITKGGSVSNGTGMIKIASRPSIHRNTSTFTLGFRCVASW